MPKRPCLDCGAPTSGTRCPTHQAMRERQRDARRGSRQQRGYDAQYERARAALHLEACPPCHWCGKPATTADHDPPLAVVGVHYHLVPACAVCNYSHRSARTD